MKAMNDKFDLSGYLERHYERRFARWSIKDPLAKRVTNGFCGPVPAEGLYQTSFGREMLMPRVRALIVAREGMRSLGMRLLRTQSQRREVEQPTEESQLELFA